jgi:sarcosine oxidase subunit gamma
MKDLDFGIVERDRLGLKGPGAADWLAAHGIAAPKSANSWAGAVAAGDAAILVARLGTLEFFLEDCAGGATLREIEPAAQAHPPGVYPVLRHDVGFLLSGTRSLEVLAQVCNMNFADLALESRPVIMTSMIGVSVLVVPQIAGAAGSSGSAGTSGGAPEYRIWCDPTFGHYMEQSLGTVVNDCGGNYRRKQGVSA